jgi:hypothetical protein
MPTNAGVFFWPTSDHFEKTILTFSVVGLRPEAAV